jgi:hypothetical protein
MQNYLLRRAVRTALLAGFTASLAACGGGGSGSGMSSTSTTSTTTSSSPQMAVMMSDASSDDWATLASRSKASR